MSWSGLLLRGLLVVTLFAAPVLRGFAVGPPHNSQGMGAHAMHMAHPEQSESHALHVQEKTGCTQHDFCNGQCCAGCAQCFAVVSYLPLGEGPRQSVLMPIETRLSTTSPAFLRERPPRTLSL